MAQEFDPLKVLLTLLSPASDPNEDSQPWSHLDPEQWDALVAEAYRQDLAPLLCSFLVRQADTQSLSLPLKEKLKRSYLTTAAQNTLALHDAEILLNTFQRAGIPAAGLKGVYLLEHVYPDIAARSMNDIDLLVRKPDLPKCLEVMDELGYKTVTYFSLADENIDTKHVPPMKKEIRASG